MSVRIPLRMTGLVVFGARVVSMFTGMVFLVMVTGWLPVDRFGLWEIITDFVAFASYPATLLGFWAARDIARGNLQGRTILVLNLALSGGGIVAYVALSLSSYGIFASGVAPFLLATLLIPSGYLTQAANSMAVGQRPAALGYALLISEFGKLGVAYPALFVFHLEIEGVILAVLASYLLQSLVLVVMLRDVLGAPLSLEVGRKWLTFAWVPALNSLPAIVVIADTLVAALASPYSTQLTGYYQAAFSIGSLVAYVQFLTTAMYPLLLRGGTDDAPNSALDLLLMFAIPMEVGVAVLSQKILALLNPIYVSSGYGVAFALGILGLASFAGAVSGFLDSILVGKERADVETAMNLQSYQRTSFWFVFRANIAFDVMYISSVFAIALLGSSAGLGVGSIVALWAIAQLSFYFPVLFVKLRRVRKGTKLVLPSLLPTYLVGAAVMAAMLLPVSLWFLPAGGSRLTFGLRIVGTVALGGIVYFGALAALSRKVRALLGSLIRTIL